MEETAHIFTPCFFLSIPRVFLNRLCHVEVAVCFCLFCGCVVVVVVVVVVVD